MKLILTKLELDNLVYKNILSDIIEPKVTITKDIPVYISGASIEDLTNFGGIIDEEPYNSNDITAYEDSDYDTYDEYYKHCRTIGYIPANTIVTIGNNGFTSTLIKNNVSICTSNKYLYIPAYEVTLTSKGEIYFKYS